jgi:hypothetical protein
MSSLAELQARFAEGLYAQALPPLDWIDAPAQCAAARYAVYRRSVRANHREALAAVYPAVQRLVGEGFFGTLAFHYGHTHGSDSGDLHRYGARLPEFLAQYPPAGGLPYLPDVARLEWAVHRAFHAADTGTLDTAALAGVPPAEYAALRFELHPACALIESAYPIERIWRAGLAQDDGSAPSIELGAGAVTLVVKRPAFEVEVEPLRAGASAFLRALAAGKALGPALQAALEAEPAFDLTAQLEQRVRDGTLVRVVPKA